MAVSRGVSENETLPPRTPPGGHSLYFSKARPLEERLHDPVRDFMAAGRSSLRSGTGPSQTAASHDPALTDDTVRGVLNFLVRTRYYEEAPDYGVNRATVKRPPPIQRQTLWGEETDEIPEMRTPPPLPTPKRSPILPPALSRPSTSTTGMPTTGLPTTPQPFRAIDWMPYRQDMPATDSSAGGTRPSTRDARSAEANDKREFETGDDKEEDFDPGDHADLVERVQPWGLSDDGESEAVSVRRVQDSWKGQNYLFHVRHLCVQHVVTHIDWINAIPMLRFSDECHSDAIKQAAFDTIFTNFESILAADSFATLNFRHAIQVAGSPRLKVQSEEKVCEAVIGWLETHHYDAVMAELELRDDLIHKLQSVSIPVHELDRNFDTLKEDCKVLDAQVQQQKEVVNKSRRHAKYLEDQLQDHTEQLLFNDRLMLQSARELGTYRPEDLLVCLYRNPNKAVQMLLEAVALMFGMEPNYLSTRRMCFEGQMVQLMAQYDFKKIKPADIALVYEYTKLPQTKASRFKTKPMIAVATWLQSASSCVKLVSDMLGDNLGIKEALQVVLDEQAVLEALERDLDVLENEEENSKARLRLAIGAQLLARLELDLCISRLVRDAQLMHKQSLALLSCVRWALLSKDFLISKVDTNNFIRKFVHTDAELDEILLAAQRVPEVEFCKKAFSCTDKRVWSADDTLPGVADVSGKLGRAVFGSSLKSEARMLSNQRSGDQVAGSRLGWAREREFSEAKGGKGAGWPKQLSITPTATPTSIGTSSMGAVVAVSGDFLLVAGGLDRVGRPHNQVLKVELTSHPRRRPIWQKDWEHCAFMSTPRAFANGGVIAAGGSGPGGERNQCLIMCGGYDEEGRHLTSTEVAQTPIADVFFPLDSLKHTRVLGTLAEATQWGKRKLLLIGGFNKHTDASEETEVVKSDISFDIMGEITVAPF